MLSGRTFESEVKRQSGDGVEGAVFGTEAKARIEVCQGRATIFPFHKNSPFLGHQDLHSGLEVESGNDLASVKLVAPLEVKTTDADPDIGLEDFSRIARDQVDGNSNQPQGVLLERQCAVVTPPGVRVADRSVAASSLKRSLIPGAGPFQHLLLGVERRFIRLRSHAFVQALLIHPAQVRRVP